MAESRTNQLFVIAVASFLIVGFIVFLVKTKTTIEDKREIPSSSEKQLRVGESNTPSVQHENMQDKVQEERDFVSDKWGEDFMNAMVSDTEKRLIPASLPMRIRIAQNVEMLRQENLKESLCMLSEIEMFYWPGAPENASEISFPLRKEEGSWLVDAILSNRRFLKLLDELSALPTEEAAEMINVEVRASLPAYLKMFEDTWLNTVTKRSSSPAGGLAEYGAGPSMRISNNVDHSPTLLGARNKLMSLLIIAGNLKLAATEAEVSRVIAAAIEQREEFYSTHEALAADRFHMLRDAGLYNRQILTTALHGVMDAGEWTDVKLWQTYELPVYNAVFTPYDLLTRDGGPLPADFSKGKLVIKIHLPLDDSEFDLMISDR